MWSCTDRGCRGVVVCQLRERMGWVGQATSTLFAARAIGCAGSRMVELGQRVRGGLLRLRSTESAYPLAGPGGAGGSAALPPAGLSGGESVSLAGCGPLDGSPVETRDLVADRCFRVSWINSGIRVRAWLRRSFPVTRFWVHVLEGFSSVGRAYRQLPAYRLNLSNCSGFLIARICSPLASACFQRSSSSWVCCTRRPSAVISALKTRSIDSCRYSHLSTGWSSRLAVFHLRSACSRSSLLWSGSNLVLLTICLPSQVYVGPVCAGVLPLRTYRVRPSSSAAPCRWDALCRWRSAVARSMTITSSWSPVVGHVQRSW